MIDEEFVVAAGILLVAIVGNLPELALALLLGHTIHLVLIHIREGLMIRRWTPGSVTSVATLPIIAIVVYCAQMSLPIRWPHVVAWTALLTILILINLRFLTAKAPAIGRWINSRYRVE